MTDGFLKVAAAIPRVRVADIAYNTQEIESLVVRAEGQGVEILCFPELSLTAYTCQDLFAQQLLLEEAEGALVRLLDLSRNLTLTFIVGLPFQHRGMLFNCAAVIHGGKLQGLVPKTFIPNYKEFYEKRWFTSAAVLSERQMVHFCGQNVPFGAKLLFSLNEVHFGVEICEDLWAPIPPSSQLAIEGAQLIFNLSASNDVVGKHSYVRQLVSGQSARFHAAYIYTSCGFGESTQDVVFGGKTIIAEDGHVLAEAERYCLEPQLTMAEIDIDRIGSERRQNTSFADSVAINRTDAPYPVVEIETTGVLHSAPLTRIVDPLPFVPQGEELDARCQEILCIQSQGLATRLVHTQGKTAVLGISGGLDSTLALLVTVNAFDRLGLDRHGIIGITMPGFGTTDRTYSNALKLMEGLGVTIREINISQAVMGHFADIDHDPTRHDVTYENAQARERTQILMDVANQLNGLVIGTGDLSEMALGWATYNGDHMSMYAVNSSVPKTLVRHLVRWLALNVAEGENRLTLLDIIDTPISPELLPADPEGKIAQITEDLVGPYELHDFFLYYVLRFGYRPGKVFRLAERAFDGQQGRPYYSPSIISQWLTTFYRRFFAQQFKRSCMPDGPKVGSCALSPRGDWRMPSDAVSTEWLKECETLLPDTTADPLSSES